MVEVKNPSEAFLAERVVNAPGSAIAVTLEGTRPLLVEVQALSSPTTFGYARRTANGIDYNRLLLLAAVLSRMTGGRVELEERIDESILAGAQVKLGDRLIDGSAAGRVARMRAHLAGAQG